MKKANSFFFLSGVSDHINADFKHEAGISHINFKHCDDSKDNALTLAVQPAANKEYILHYKIVLNGEVFATAQSDLIPAAEICGVIASLANEIIAK